MNRTTYEKEMENPEFRHLMERERFMLELSENIAKAMEEEQKNRQDGNYPQPIQVMPSLLLDNVSFIDN